MVKNRLNQNPMPSRDGQPIKLTDAEGQSVQAFEQALTQAKCQIADAYLQLQRSHAVREQLEARFIGGVRQIAINHGIAVDDPSAGMWNLNIQTMSFDKVG